MASYVREKDKANMRVEEVNDLVSSVTLEERRLRQEVEKNVMTLTQYEISIQDGKCESIRNPSYQGSIQAFLSSLINAPVSVLRKASARLRRLVRKVLSISRYAVRYLPRLLVGDHITLEDALGRHMRLPFHSFDRVQTLRHYIKHIFQGVPGRYQVDRDRFRLDFESSRRGVKKHHTYRKLRPGDHLVMSIVSIMPAELEKSSKSWICPRCCVQVTLEPSVSDCKWCTCDRGFMRELASPRQNVRPSDGDCNGTSMMAQKEATNKISRSVQYGERSARDENMVDAVSPVSKPMEDFNPGVAPLKNVLLFETNQPSEVLDAVEELLHKVWSQSKVLRDSSDDSNLQYPLRVLEVLRSEAERTNEINMFDFEKEHVEFMRITREVMLLLGCQIMYSTPGTAMAQTSNYFDKLAKWTKERFPQARLSRSSNLWMTSPGNPQYRPDRATPDGLEERQDALLMLRSLTGKLSLLRVNPNFTVGELKRTMQDREGVPVDQQYLVAKGKKMEDHHTVGQHGLTGAPKWYVHTLLPIWRGKA